MSCGQGTSDCCLHRKTSEKALFSLVPTSPRDLKSAPCGCTEAEPQWMTCSLSDLRKAPLSGNDLERNCPGVWVHMHVSTYTRGCENICVCMCLKFCKVLVSWFLISATSLLVWSSSGEAHNSIPSKEKAHAFMLRHLQEAVIRSSK